MSPETPEAPSSNRHVYPTVALTCGYRSSKDTETWDRASLPRSTGCDAQIHSSATMSMAHTWRAPAAGVTSNVIPLEERYFDLGAAKTLRLGTLAECGCAMDGVGCQQCGNALGAHLSPCAWHTHAIFRYIFLPNAVWPPLPPPTNPAPVPENLPTALLPAPQGHEAREILEPSSRARALQAYEAQVRAAFPPHARVRLVGSESQGVPRDFTPRASLRGPSPYAYTGVLDGSETIYGEVVEPARTVRVVTAGAWQPGR
ncbi:hypothetical protein B0H11DRAFT_858739 [Mycena galericulata]|nr:hypothetical protein B0H11DRAFT_858739 [Mycena galericulata]